MMETGWEITSVPKPPGVRQLISPPDEVLPRAPAKVRHGWVTLQLLVGGSTPMLDTHVRANGCASAGIDNSARPIAATKVDSIEFFISLSLILHLLDFHLQRI